MLGVISLFLMLSTFEEDVTYFYNEVDCLAKNIYFEARDQSHAGQLAVGYTTLNRVESEDYPNSICEVVYEPSQFSWYWDGKSDTPRELAAWEYSQNIAKEILVNYYIKKDSLSQELIGATHYHNSKVCPWWAQYMTYVIRIDNHIFYKMKRKHNLVDPTFTCPAEFLYEQRQLNKANERLAGELPRRGNESNGVSAQ